MFPASDVNEAVTRFEAGSLILLIGDGIAPPADLVAALAEEPEPAVATSPTTRRTRRSTNRRRGALGRGCPGQFENAWIDRRNPRRLGPAIDPASGGRLQDGAVRWPVGGDNGAEPLLIERAEQLDGFQRSLLAGSREPRRDWASRYVLPPIEEFAVRQSDGDPGSGQAGWRGRRLA